MWLDDDAPISKRDLTLTKPMVNGPGMLGFVPDPHTMPFLQDLGAFITHPISRRPRQPAKNRCYSPFPGGFLLHTGYPNPGLLRVIQNHKRAWAEAPLPVIVHLLAETPEGVAEMVHKFEGLENILGVELGIPPDCSATMLQNFMDAALGELPTVINLNPEVLPILMETLIAQQPTAVHLGPARGSLLDSQGNLINGRLFGPCFFPITLSAARAVVDSGLPVIAGCGVFHPKQVQALLDIGALAVSPHAALWGIGSSGLFK
jgi:dihydroorotate dehydrogenase (NAD+) catalytic subunit